MITKQDLHEHIKMLERKAFIHDGQEFQNTILFCLEVLTELNQHETVKLEDL